jgi:predicted nucleic acid-binding protein
MPIIVTDTSPVRALEFIGQLHLLEALFGEVLLPPAVATELLKPTSKLKPIDVRLFPFFKTQSPKDRTVVNALRLQLDAGESEAIALAIELKADAILIDESRGRRVAIERGLEIIGVLGILLKAKARGLVPAIKPFTDQLQTGLRFRLSKALLDQVLKKAGEAK